MHELALFVSTVTESSCFNDAVITNKLLVVSEIYFDVLCDRETEWALDFVPYLWVEP